MSKPSSKFSQSEKVALLLISLGDDLASELIQKLPRPEAQRVLQAMSRLPKVDEGVILDIQSEFKTLLESFKSPLSSGPDAALKILSKAFHSDDAAKFINGLPKATPQCFRDAEAVDSKTLWQILSPEHPQTIALILGHLSPKKAGELSSLMPDAVRNEILTRLAKIQDVNPEMLGEIDEVLSKAVEAALHQKSHRIGGPQKTSAILAQLSPEQRKSILESLAERSPQVADEVQAGLFTFDDLLKINSRGMEALLSKVVPVDLELALRKCDDRVAHLFFSAMSTRRAEQLKENIANAKPVNISKIEEAQRKIAALAVEMISKGEIQDPMDEAV